MRSIFTHPRPDSRLTLSKLTSTLTSMLVGNFNADLIQNDVPSNLQLSTTAGRLPCLSVSDEPE